MRGMSADMMSPDADQEATQIVGRQIWRVVPYAKRYLAELPQEYFPTWQQECSIYCHLLPWDMLLIISLMT